VQQSFCTFHGFISPYFSGLKGEKSTFQKSIFPRLCELGMAHSCGFQSGDLVAGHLKVESQVAVWMPIVESIFRPHLLKTLRASPGNHPASTSFCTGLDGCHYPAFLMIEDADHRITGSNISVKLFDGLRLTFHCL
jgi:hypothetical protein